MAHILVKWPTENRWDVYPLKNVVDASIGLDLLGDTAATLERLEDETVDIIWEAGKPAAPAKILAVGESGNFFVCVGCSRCQYFVMLTCQHK